MSDLQDRIVNGAFEHWSRLRGLVFALIATALLLLGLFSRIQLEEISPAEIALGVVVLLAVTVAWFFTRLPRTPRNKIGLGVAIRFEDPEHAKRLRSDFIETLRELLAGSRTSDFAFIDFPEHISKRVIDETVAARVATQSGVTCLIWGRGRLRTLPEGETHLLDFRCLVRHAPITREASQGISQDINVLIPSRIRLERKAETFGCEFTARHINIAARYIIGTAVMAPTTSITRSDSCSMPKTERKMRRIGMKAHLLRRCSVVFVPDWSSCTRISLAY